MTEAGAIQFEDDTAGSPIHEDLCKRTKCYVGAVVIVLKHRSDHCRLST